MPPALASCHHLLPPPPAIASCHHQCHPGDMLNIRNLHAHWVPTLPSATSLPQLEVGASAIWLPVPSAPNLEYMSPCGLMRHCTAISSHTAIAILMCSQALSLQQQYWRMPSFQNHGGPRGSSMFLPLVSIGKQKVRADDETMPSLRFPDLLLADLCTLIPPPICLLLIPLSLQTYGEIKSFMENSPTSDENDLHFLFLMRNWSKPLHAMRA